MKIKYHVIWLQILFSSFAFGQNHFADSLLSVVKTTKQDTAKVNAFNNLFIEFEFKDDVKAKEYLDSALSINQRIDFKKGLSVTYLYLGYFAEDKGDFKDALKHYTSCLKINEEIKNKIGVADAYNSIGNVFASQGNYPEALKNFFAALKIREKNIFQKDIASHKKGIAAAYGNIGSIYGIQENYPLAIKYQSQCLKTMKEIGNKLGEANSYNNIGVLYAGQDIHDKALENYSASLKIMEEIGNMSGVASSYTTIANVYSRQANETQDPLDKKNKLDKALEYHLAGLKIKLELKEKSGIAISYSCLAIVYTRLKKYNLAEDYIFKGLELSKEVGQKKYIRDAYLIFTNLDSAKGNYRGAYENHKHYILYRDSIDNETTRKKTIQNQMNYDFEKKEAIAQAEHKKELESQEAISSEKNRRQKVVIMFVVCGLLLVMIFAGFVFRSLRITKKQKIVIEEQKCFVEQQKLEVEFQKQIVEEHQKDIIDSILYARRIQRSLLPTEKYIEKTIARLKKK